MAKTTRETCRWLVIITIVAFAARLLYVLKLGDGVHWPDEAEYHGIAVHLLSGKGYSYFRGVDSALSPTMYRAPGLPAFLASIYFFAGPSLLAARIAQAVLGAMLLPVGYAISRQLGYGTRSALLAVFILAIYPYYVFCAGAVYPIVLSTLLLALAILALLRGRNAIGIGWECAAGALTGVAGLTFGHVLGATPFVLLWIVVNKQAARRSGIAAAAGFLLVCVLTLVPWVVRNALVVGKPGLSTAFEYNLCLGNAPGSKWDSGSRISELASPEMQKRISLLSEADAARVYLSEAKREIRKNPARFIALSAGKAANFWRPYPKPAARGVSMMEKSVGLLTYAPILLLSLVWIVRSRQQFRTMFLLLAYPVAAMLLAAVTVSVDRYRLPFDVYLIVFASAALTAWLQRRNPQNAK